MTISHIFIPFFIYIKDLKTIIDSNQNIIDSILNNLSLNNDELLNYIKSLELQEITNKINPNLFNNLSKYIDNFNKCLSIYLIHIGNNFIYKKNCIDAINNGNLFIIFQESIKDNILINIPLNSIQLEKLNNYSKSWLYNLKQIKYWIEINDEIDIIKNNFQNIANNLQILQNNFLQNNFLQNDFVYIIYNCKLYNENNKYIKDVKIKIYNESIKDLKKINKINEYLYSKFIIEIIKVREHNLPYEKYGLLLKDFKFNKYIINNYATINNIDYLISD